MMKTSIAKVSFFLDKRHELKSERYSVKLNVFYKGMKKRFNIGITTTETIWEKFKANNTRHNEVRLLKRKLSSLQTKAEDIIENLHVFSFKVFEHAYFGKPFNIEDLLLSSRITAYIEKLKFEGRVGTAGSYESTKNSLYKFKGNVMIQDITSDYLEEYKRYMSEKKASPTTTGIYMRQLRRIINIAIKDGVIPNDKYPFRGISIPTSRNPKKALTTSEIKMVFDYCAVSKEQKRAIDFWKLSYLLNGMNMADICLLKKSNIEGGFVYYHRSKTANTKRKDLRPISVPLLPVTWQIINRWKDNSDNEYLFSILQNGLSASQKRDRIKDFTKDINTKTKKIGIDLGITVKLTTYAARHSYSTMLKRKGAPIALIQESLGHSSLTVTENYLADFDDETKIEYARLLIQF